MTCTPAASATMKRSQNIAPSMVYAYASLMEGVPFANGAPNLTVDIPAMHELAHERELPICGKDFKTGQTLLKTVLAPAFKARLLGLSGWYSTNILGILAHDEGHHAGRTVLRRVGHESEPTGHFALGNEVFRSAGGVFSLASQAVVIVTAEGSGSAGAAGSKALRRRRRHQGPDGALGFARGSFPIKAVVLSFITEDLFGVLVVVLGGVFLLRRHQLLANANGREFIPPNSPENNFLLARLGVEIPPLAVVHERYGRGPVFRTNIQVDGSVRFFHQAVHLLIFLEEIGAALGILGFVARRDNFLSVGSEDLEHGFLVIIPGCRHQRLGGFFRRGKRFLARLLREGTRGKSCRQKQGNRR